MNKGKQFLSSLIDNSQPGSMNSVTASASAYISLSLSISPPTRKARSKFQLGKCKPLISSNFDCKCRALGEGSQPETQSQTIQPTIYQGVYGPWTIEDSDIREVKPTPPCCAMLFIYQFNLELLHLNSLHDTVEEKCMQHSLNIIEGFWHFLLLQ